MKKIILTAIMAATLAVSSSAFAETSETMTATYDKTTGEVTIAGSGTDLATTTYLVLARGEAEGFFQGSIDDTDDDETNNTDIIKQINEEPNAVTTFFVAKDLPAGNYEVRVGGDGSMRQALFTVEDENVDPPVDEPKRLLGDVKEDGFINVSDITPIVNHAAEIALLTGDDFKAADTNPDGYVNVSDITPIVNYAAELTSNLGNTYID